MQENLEPIILIPARLASTRLPNKPLAEIAGLPMIVHVVNRARESGCGRVVVAAGEQEIVDAVTSAGAEAVLTPADLPSGTDRIHNVLQQIDPEKKYQVIVNVQGDLPTLDPKLIKSAVSALGDADMSTLLSEITDESERHNPNVVKAVLSLGANHNNVGRALYFSRATVPNGDGPHYHHIGLYVYRRDALERFVTLPPSALEVRERLEQLRALEAGFAINAAIVDTVPLGVDTAEDLEKACLVLS